jgi:AcrR family transcriptional regulator
MAKGGDMADGKSGAAGTAQRRSRDAEATRQALLAAACMHFAHRGFDGTSVRDVARDAGVDQALVYRYFGSKAALYDEVLRSYAAKFDAFVSTDDGDFPARMVSHLLDAPAGMRIDPLLAVLRGPVPAGGGSALSVPGLVRDFVDRLAETAPGAPAEARLRASLVAALTVGIPIMREVIGDESLAGATAEQVTPLYAEIVRALLHAPRD